MGGSPAVLAVPWTGEGHWGDPTSMQGDLGVGARILASRKRTLADLTSKSVDFTKTLRFWKRIVDYKPEGLAMSVTVKFTDEEFNALIEHFMGDPGEVDLDYEGMLQKLQEASMHQPKRLKPNANKVWEALKGVVG